MPATQEQTFQHDHILRDAQMRPVGRVVLVADNSYVRGLPIRVAVLSVPISVAKSVFSYVFYVDGLPYQVSKSTPKIKISQVQGKHMVNNFFLEPV